MNWGRPGSHGPLQECVVGGTRSLVGVFRSLMRDTPCPGRLSSSRAADLLHGAYDPQGVGGPPFPPPGGMQVPWEPVAFCVVVIVLSAMPATWRGDSRLLLSCPEGAASQGSTQARGVIITGQDATRKQNMPLVSTSFGSCRALDSLRLEHRHMTQASLRGVGGMEPLAGSPCAQVTVWRL